MSKNVSALFLAVILIALWVEPCLAQNRKEARLHYKKGLWAYRSRNIEGAIKNFSDAIEDDSEFPHPWLALARIYQEDFNTTMHGYIKAVNAFENLSNILTIKPPSDKSKDLLQGYYYKGLLYLKGGEYQKALLALERFLELYPDFSEAGMVHNAMGIAKYYLDEYDSAVANFKKSLELDPTISEARFNLRSVFTRVRAYNDALAFYRAGEPARALKRLESLRSLAPRYLKGRKLEAKLLADLGRDREAVAVYNEILGFSAYKPESYLVRTEMARLLIRLDLKEEARATLFQNLQLFPDNSDHHARMEMNTLLQQVSGP